MNGKDVKGLAVIGIAGGAKLGTVGHAYLDPYGRRIIAFVVDTASMFGGGSGAGIVAADDVHSLGPDALTVDDAAAVQQDAALGQEGSLLDLDDLTKLKVVTEGGAFVGQVASVEFDPATFQLTSLEASPGLFKSNTTVPLDQVISVGTDVVVVTDAVGAEPATGPSESVQATSSPTPLVVGDVEPNEPAAAPGITPAHGGAT